MGFEFECLADFSVDFVEGVELRLWSVSHSVAMLTHSHNEHECIETYLFEGFQFEPSF